MDQRETPNGPSTATLQRIVASTLALTAGATSVTLAECGGSLGHEGESTGDASPTDTWQADSMSDSSDASPTNPRPKESSVDSEEPADAALVCDVGYVSCCPADACSCFVPPVTTKWVPCGADAEAGPCSSAPTPFQCNFAGAEESCPIPPGVIVTGPYYRLVDCVVVGVDAGASQIECTWGPGICGRRPRGFVARRVRAPDQTARYFAECAQLEAASIDAFEILGAELERLGAPRHLVAAARRAARDEVRHARTMEALAGTRGAIANRRKAECDARRSLRAIAIENAVEGCVRETYGALVAMWQAQTAANPRIRHAMRRIGADEARHGQLAWNVHGWLDTRLSPAARRAVACARQNALGTLRAELDRSPHESLARAAGLPRRGQATLLFDRLTKAVTAWGTVGRS
jgi:hypothetical protein